MIVINSLEHSQVYILYDVFKSMYDELFQRADRTENDETQLNKLKLQLGVIEEFSRNKMEEKLH